MEYRAFLDSLGITDFPQLGEVLFAEAMEDYRVNGCRWASESYLLSLDTDLKQYGKHRAYLFGAAEKIRENEALGRFTTLLAAIVQKDYTALHTCPWHLPIPPDGADPAPYELTGVLALLSRVPQASALLHRWGLPEPIIQDSLSCVLNCISMFKGHEQPAGFNADRVRWCIHYVLPDILRVGRLEFEICRFGGAASLFRSSTGNCKLLMNEGRFHRSGQILGSAGCTDEEGAFSADFRETETYWEGVSPDVMGTVRKTRVRLDKAGWHCLLQPGDPVLSVHIPGGPKLDHTLAEDAYRTVREAMARCRPDFPLKAMVCGSWLMNPLVGKLMAHRGNIDAFQRDFLPYPLASQGRAVYSFLFHMPDAKPEDVPGDTTVRRLIRERLVKGEYLYEFGGILKPTVSGIQAE